MEGRKLSKRVQYVVSQGQGTIVAEGVCDYVTADGYGVEIINYLSDDDEIEFYEGASVTTALVNA